MTAVLDVKTSQAGRPGLLQRISDHLNPILVRDVLQATRSKVFLVVMMLACVSLVLVAYAGTRGLVDDVQSSRMMFRTALTLLAILLLSVVPLQAYLSMRAEFQDNTADHLLCTTLWPMTIVLGKLQSAVVLGMLYYAVFAPLISLCYLMQGVDILTIILALTLLALGCVLMTAAVLSLMWLRRFRRLRSVVTTAVLIGLGWLGFQSVVGMESHVTWMAAAARQTHFVNIFLAYTMVPVVVTMLLAVIGAASLSNLQEGTARSLRILGLIATPLITLGAGGTFESSPLAMLMVAPFWFLAVTESDKLQTRHVPFIPRRRRLALLNSCLIPGNSRGLLYAVVLALLVLCTCAFTQPIFSSAGYLYRIDQAVLGFLYTLFYAALVRHVRQHVVDQDRGTTARVRLVLVPYLVLLWFVIGMVDMAFRSMLQALGLWENPFFLFSMVIPIPPMSHISNTPLILHLVVVLLLSFLMMRLGLGAMVHGVREVLVVRQKGVARAA